MRRRFIAILEGTMKLVSSLVLAITFTGSIAIGCRSNATATFDIAAMQKIIEEKNKQFTAAHITGDSAFLVNIFTHDGKAFPPNSEVVIGHPAIAAVNAEYFKFDIREFREETTAFYGNADYLIDEGNYYLRYGKDNTIDRGKYLNVWKKEDGDWKIFSNMWNTSLPVAPAK